MTKNVCLFAQYHPRGRVPEHTLHYLAALRDCGFIVHMAMSGCDEADPADVPRLRQLGVHWHPRPNRGLDFGAWQHLLGLDDVVDADRVLLANDSVFGPLRPLGALVARMEADAPDVWGMVESHENGWHLQSWFLCFRRAALAAPPIRRVLSQPFGEMDKREIVLHGELGMGAAILAAGLRWRAAWQPPRRGLRRLVATNPLHVDWRTTLDRVPFLKVELLRDNPARIPWAGEWRRALADHPPQMRGMIEAHLNAVTGRPDGPAASLRMRAVYALLSLDRMDAVRTLLRPWRAPS
ncbi:rhamnan synthesis F family protein [Rhizosaccharibacter radicis]|uniref:Rhamnan synthesis F family protein n=1 Tax=Rhizosaccharibacter radicis TaxID=2782605 RepID=A0ABT1VZE4_9PROT|nr:rhamnan synthesis F family protein [Acetobacteraceae bacterium KSS12]